VSTAVDGDSGEPPPPLLLAAARQSLAVNEQWPAENGGRQNYLLTKSWER
jgi:hypothetical protein